MRLVPPLLEPGASRSDGRSQPNRRLRIALETLDEVGQFIGIDDPTLARRGAARARLGELLRKAIVVRDLFAGPDRAGCDDARPSATVAVELGFDLRVGFAGVVDPASLIDHIEVEV